MIFKKFGNLITGIFFLVLAIAVCVMSTKLPASLMGGLGSDFMPKVLAIFTGVLSIFQIISGIRTMKEYEAEEQEMYPPEYLRVVITIVIFTVYVFTIKPVGFLLSTIVCLFALMAVLAPKEKRNLILFAVISIVFSVVVYYLFRNTLNVMLPTGILG